MTLKEGKFKTIATAVQSWNVQLFES